jgi:hypothetical protein
MAGGEMSVSCVGAGVFDLLARSEEGQRLLLNFYYAHKYGQLAHDLLEKLVGEWAAQLSTLPGGAAECFSDFTNCLKTAYELILGAARLSVLDGRAEDVLGGVPTRVIKFENLTEGEHALLRKDWFMMFPAYHSSAARDNPAFHRLVEEAQGDPDALALNDDDRPKMVRGRLPLSFVTAGGEFDGRVCPTMPSEQAAEDARDSLAIQYFKGDHLYWLRYPADPTGTRRSCRTTFAEALDNPYFKARRVDNDHTTPVGTTLDLAHVPSGTFAGLSEVIVSDEQMSTEFQWGYLGRVGADPPAVGHHAFAVFLAAPERPEDACAAALAQLNSFLK